ncbi:hypothetical protein ACFWU5_01955 [Nocardia sp. NPDC058640]|uniref:DUF7674 family protein n=1 Tax=Nocardia sp. NPDC058640 TaxID=3346571 RepID=UPI003663F654
MESKDDEIYSDAAAWSSEQAPSQIKFIEFLARVEPEFGQIVAEHERDYGEILPTLVMGDIARRIAAIANAGGTESNPRLSKVFDAFEQGWDDGQNPVADLIAVGFVENTYGQPLVVKLMGRNLLRYQRIYTGKEAVQARDMRPAPGFMAKFRGKLGRS